LLNDGSSPPGRPPAPPPAPCPAAPSPSRQFLQDRGALLVGPVMDDELQQVGVGPDWHPRGRNHRWRGAQRSASSEGRDRRLGIGDDRRQVEEEPLRRRVRREESPSAGYRARRRHRRQVVEGREVVGVHHRHIDRLREAGHRTAEKACPIPGFGGRRTRTGPRRSAGRFRRLPGLDRLQRGRPRQSSASRRPTSAPCRASSRRRRKRRKGREGRLAEGAGGCSRRRLPVLGEEAEQAVRARVRASRCARASSVTLSGPYGQVVGRRRVARRAWSARADIIPCPGNQFSRTIGGWDIVRGGGWSAGQWSRRRSWLMLLRFARAIVSTVRSYKGRIRPGSWRSACAGAWRIPGMRLTSGGRWAIARHLARL